MSLGVKVAIPGLAELVGRLDDFRSDQLPFALSKAMNLAAKDALDTARQHIGSVFTLRSGSLVKTFGPFGRMGDVSRGWSNKAQWPNLRVAIHSQAHAMQLQEEGGQKPRKARNVWIPSKYVERAASGRKKERHRKSVVLARIESPKGVWRPFIKGRNVYERNRKTGQIHPLYFIRQKATVPPRLRMEEHVLATYNAKLWPRFSQSMADAIAKAKPKNRYSGRKLI